MALLIQSIIVLIAGAIALTRFPANTAIFPDIPVMLFFIPDIAALNAEEYLAKECKPFFRLLNRADINVRLIRVRSIRLMLRSDFTRPLLDNADCPLCLRRFRKPEISRPIPDTAPLAPVWRALKLSRAKPPTALRAACPTDFSILPKPERPLFADSASGPFCRSSRSTFCKAAVDCSAGPCTTLKSAAACL